jgi:hypothetical protein
MKRSRTISKWITAIGAAGCLLLLAARTVAADQWFDLNDKALAVVSYDGKALPTTIEELKKEFPAATLDSEQSESKSRIECYLVDHLPTANSARFYFCDGRLYQFDARFDQARIEKLGGSRAFLNKLLASWGHADHVGESRWTWQRPMYSRRADYYARPDSAQLTITDTAWMPVATQRLTGNPLEVPNRIGF